MANLPFPATKAAMRSLTLKGVLLLLWVAGEVVLLFTEGVIVGVKHLLLLLAGLFSLEATTADAAASESCWCFEEFLVGVDVVKANDFSSVIKALLEGEVGEGIVAAIVVVVSLAGLRLTIVVLITVVVRGDEGVLLLERVSGEVGRQVVEVVAEAVVVASLNEVGGIRVLEVGVVAFAGNGPQFSGGTTILR